MTPVPEPGERRGGEGAPRGREPALGRRVVRTWRWTRSLLATLARRRREERLTVAVDVASFWEPVTGVARYLQQLLVELAGREDVALRLYGPTLLPTPEQPAPTVEIPSGPAVERVVYEVPGGLLVPSRWIVRALRRLEPLLIAADANRVLFAPNYFLPRRFSLARGRLVVMVHDLGSRIVPWTLAEETRRELGLYLEAATSRASHLLTPSRAVADELVAHGYAEPSAVTPVHHGASQLGRVEAGEPPPGAPARYALFVGTIEPRKNLGVLLDAWQLLAERGTEPPTLLVCGRLGWKSSQTARRLEEAERSGLARRLGYVEDRQLAALYRDAVTLAFPSLYEGFGLPVVEALADGVPVVASDIPVLREVAADAALYAPPDDPDAWAEALGRLFAEPALRREMAERGRARAAAFSWRRAAEETLAVWRTAGEAR